jgi:hypothetical protein
MDLLTAPFSRSHRHCERSEAIQVFALQEDSWIATALRASR